MGQRETAMRFNGIDVPDDEIDGYLDDTYRRSVDHLIAMTDVDDEFARMMIDGARRLIGDAQRRMIDGMADLAPNNAGGDRKAALTRLVATAFLCCFKPVSDDVEWRPNRPETDA